MTKQEAKKQVQELVRKSTSVPVGEVVADLKQQGCSDDEARAAVRSTLEEGSVDLDLELELVAPA